MSKERGKVKITVLKVFKPEEIFEDQPVKAKDPKPCPEHKVGQVFYFEEKVPEGFCTFAWDAIWPFVMALSRYGNFPYYEDPGVAVISCPDGLRPVIFMLELVE